MASDESVLVQCYHKGCQKKYNPKENNESACRHHPGEPVFHDAYKGWSCCKKKVTDFTEFLNIPGCTSAFHSNAKPEVIEKPSKPDAVHQGDVISMSETPKQEPVKLERPPIDTPLVSLKCQVAQTLKVALEKRMEELTVNGEEVKDSGGKGSAIKIGTSCKNNACTKTYNGEGSNNEECTFHPGVPIFHEGMKYWSCCQRKTTEFDSFLKQEGCARGKHIWTKKEDDNAVEASCRYDFHQTATDVIVTVYSKLPDPDISYVKVNPICLEVYIMFDANKKIFEQKFILQGIIDVEKCHVSMTPSKVEIKLKKAECVMWRNLNCS